MNKLERFSQLTAIMSNIYEQKNKKYGDSFSKTFKEYGGSVLCLRLDDKLSRIKSIILNNETETIDETLKDTFIDMANYAIMAVMELEENNNKVV